MKISELHLKINPAGTVPVLLHNGHPIYESHEQIRYIANNCSSLWHSLIPNDPSVRKQMERWVDCSSLTNNPIGEMGKSAGNCIPGITFPLFSAMVEQIPFWNFSEGFLFHFDKRRPALFSLLKIIGLEKIFYLTPVFNIYERSVFHMAHFINSLEKQLNDSKGPWILGNQFTLADISWLVILERFNQANCLELFLNEATPACGEYYHALKRRKSYIEGISNFNHSKIESATERIINAKSKNPRLKSALG